MKEKPHIWIAPTPEASEGSLAAPYFYCMRCGLLWTEFNKAEPCPKPHQYVEKKHG